LRASKVSPAVTGDFHHGKIVAVAECGGRHIEAALVDAYLERQPAAVKTLGALAVGHPQHRLPECGSS
jgi:hypothetical protein